MEYFEELYSQIYPKDEYKEVLALHNIHYLNSDSHLPKKIVLFKSSFNMLKNCFLFHLKSSFCSQDILVFVTTFWSCKKNGLIRKVKKASEFMTSQSGLQTIAVHILSNISQGKDNQTMKFGQLIEYSKRNIFLQNLCRKWSRDTSPRPLLIVLESLTTSWKWTTS